MAHAMDYADRIVALKGGRVFFDRPVSRVTPADLRDTFDG
jgi:phosphonate transport system ATP-binding protein